MKNKWKYGNFKVWFKSESRNSAEKQLWLIWFESDDLHCEFDSNQQILGNLGLIWFESQSLLDSNQKGKLCLKPCFCHNLK